MAGKLPEAPPRDPLSEKLESAIGPIKAEIEAIFPQLKLSKIFIKDLRFSIGEPIRSDWWAASCQNWEEGCWEVQPQGESHSNRSGQSDLLNAIKEIFERLNKSRGVNVKKVSIFLRAGEEQLCETLGIEVQKENGMCFAELDFTFAKKLKKHRGVIASVFLGLAGVAIGVATVVAQKKHAHDSNPKGPNPDATNVEDSHDA